MEKAMKEKRRVSTVWLPDTFGPEGIAGARRLCADFETVEGLDPFTALLLLLLLLIPLLASDRLLLWEFCGLLVRLPLPLLLPFPLLPLVANAPLTSLNIQSLIVLNLEKIVLKGTGTSMVRGGERVVGTILGRRRRRDIGHIVGDKCHLIVT